MFVGFQHRRVSYRCASETSSFIHSDISGWEVCIEAERPVSSMDDSPNSIFVQAATEAMDVSADLHELARCPVGLVSGGVKSILDIGRSVVTSYPCPLD